MGNELARFAYEVVNSIDLASETFTSTGDAVQGCFETAKEISSFKAVSVSINTRALKYVEAYTSARTRW